LASPVTNYGYDHRGNQNLVVDPLGNATRTIYNRFGNVEYALSPRPDDSIAYTHIIDDEDTGFTMTAGWSDWTTSQSYNGDYQYHGSAPGSSDYALWEFGSLDVGKNYEIFVTWPVFPGNAPDAPYEILDVNSVVLKTMTLDQNLAPADETVASVAWQRLGVFAGSTAYKVKVKPGSGWVGADAVRIVEVGPTIKYAYDEFGNVLSTTDALNNKTSYGYDAFKRRTSVTQPDPDGPTGPLNAPILETNYDDDGSVKEEIDALDNATRFLYDELGQTLEVTAPDPDGPTGEPAPITSYAYDAAGQLKTVTDALGRVTRYFYDELGRQTVVASPIADPTITPAELYRDEDVAGFAPNIGSWPSAAGGYGDDHRYHDAGTVNDWVEWTFAVDTSKTYQVLATWQIHTTDGVPTSATNAPYVITDGSTQVGFYRVNQRSAPSDETTMDGPRTIGWHRLGFYKPTSTTFKVKLRADANGRVDADAVRLVEVGSLQKTVYNEVGNPVASIDALGNETITVYDHRDRVSSVQQPVPDPNITPYRGAPVDNPTNSDWTTVSDSRAYGGSYLRANGSSSSYPTYTMAVPSLSYYPTLAVMATWVPDEENISNALFRVFDNFNNEIGSIYVDQTVAPSDYRDENGRWWAILGVYPMIPFYTSVKVSPQIGAQADAARLIELGPRAVKNNYDVAGQLTSSIDARGATTSYLYDNLGRQTKVTLPDPDGAGSTYTSSVYETRYDANGNVAYTIDAMGTESFFEHDNLGRQTQVFHPLATGTQYVRIRDGGDVATYLYGSWTLDTTQGYQGEYHHSTAGAVGANAVYDMAYDLLPDKTYQVFVTWVPSANNAPDVRYDQYKGAWVDTVSVNQQLAPSDYVDANGVAWHRIGTVTGRTHYGMRVNAETSVGAGSANRVVTDAVMLLQMDSSTETAYDGSGNVASTTDQVGRVAQFTYDNIGRQIESKLPDPDGAGSQISPLTKFEYDANGNLRYEEVRLTAGPDTFLTTEHQYDGLNRETKTIDANGDATSFKYDAVGNMIELTDAELNTTKFYFDRLNQVIEEKNALGASRFFDYDANGHRTKSTDRNGKVIEHYFDRLGREVEERWKDGASTVRSIQYGYDAASQMTSADDDGPQARDYDWFYDQMGRVKEMHWHGGDLMPAYTFELQNMYYFSSQRSQRKLHVNVDPNVHPSFDTLIDNWYHDRQGRLIEQHQSDAIGNPRKAIYEYFADGQLAKMDRHRYTTSWNLLVQSQWSHDDAGRIKDLKHFKPDGTTLLAGYGYGWDAAGRMTSMDFSSHVRNNDSEDVAAFTHDAAGQLTGADRPNTANDEGYTYDDNGNRELVSRDGVTNQDWVVDPNNQLADDGKFTYDYDAEGNQISRTRKNPALHDQFRTEFTWDHRNRLTKVTFKRNATSGGQATTDPAQMVVTGTVEYYYDMFNRWTIRDHDPDGALGASQHNIEHFMHDGQETIVHGVSNNAPTRWMMHGPLPDMVVFDARNVLSVPLGDHLNTIRDVVDTSGNIINHLTIDSFGRRVAESDGNVEMIIGLGGRPYDEVTGLQNHHNRWYQVDTGRWMSEDPIGFAAGDANLNRFVGNMVVVAIDPSGLELTPQREGQLVHTFIGLHVRRSNPTHLAFLNREVSTIIRDTLRKGIPRDRSKPDIVLVEPGPGGAFGPLCGQAWLYEIKPATPFWIPVGAIEAAWYTSTLNGHGLKTKVGNGTHGGVNGAGYVPSVGPITWRFAGVGVIAYTIVRPTPQPQLVPTLVPVPVGQPTPVLFPLLVPNIQPLVTPPRAPIPVNVVPGLGPQPRPTSPGPRPSIRPAPVPIRVFPWFWLYPPDIRGPKGELIG
jgi:RHS repeat-associated protein